MPNLYSRLTQFCLGRFLLVTECVRKFIMLLCMPWCKCMCVWEYKSHIWTMEMQYVLKMKGRITDTIFFRVAIVVFFSPSFSSSNRSTHFTLFSLRCFSHTLLYAVHYFHSYYQQFLYKFVFCLFNFHLSLFAYFFASTVLFGFALLSYKNRQKSHTHTHARSERRERKSEWERESSFHC